MLADEPDTNARARVSREAAEPGGLQLHPSESAPAALADHKGGFGHRMYVAECIAGIGFPLMLNAVMHRHNPDDPPATITLALRVGVRTAKATVGAERHRLKGAPITDFVAPDWFSGHFNAFRGTGGMSPRQTRLSIAAPASDERSA